MNAAFRVSGNLNFHWGNEGLRYTFNGVEQESELNSGALFTEFRIVDSRLGRWFSQDPIVKCWESPYAGFANNPIYFVDPSGLDPGTGDDPAYKGSYASMPASTDGFKVGEYFDITTQNSDGSARTARWQVLTGDDGNLFFMGTEMSGRMSEVVITESKLGGNNYSWSPSPTGISAINNAPHSTLTSAEGTTAQCGNLVYDCGPNTSEITYSKLPNGEVVQNQNVAVGFLQPPMIDPIDFLGGLSGGIIAAERTASEQAVNASYKRFISARAVNTRSSATWTMENGNNVFRVTVPGSNGQSYAVYEKVVSKSGTTLSTVKSTYTNSGTLIHAKPK